MSREEFVLAVGLGPGIGVGFFVIEAFLGQSLASPRTYVLTFAVPLLIAAIGIGVVDLLHVRRVAVADSGVQFVTRWMKVVVPWENVRPAPAYRTRNWFPIRWVNKRGTPSLLYLLSLDQARLLLANPSASKLPFPAEVWKLVGLPAPLPPPQR